MCMDGRCVNLVCGLFACAVRTSQIEAFNYWSRAARTTRPQPLRACRSRSPVRGIWRTNREGGLRGTYWASLAIALLAVVATPYQAARAQSLRVIDGDTIV